MTTAKQVGMSLYNYFRLLLPHRHKQSTSVHHQHFHYRWQTEVLFLVLLLTVHINAAHNDSYLIYSNLKEIRRLDLVNVVHPRGGRLSNNNTPTFSSVIIDHLEETVALDFDYERQIIFWSDVGYESISSLRLSDRHTFDIVTESIISPDGIAVDWWTKKIYWADSDLNRIEVALYDGSLRTVLFSRDLDQPRALVLVPSEGLIFWSDWGYFPKIERASMDGDPATRKIIVDRDIAWPNGLTVDYEEKRLYWIDAKIFEIASADYEGSYRSKVSCGSVVHPFAITIDGGNNMLYWSDISTRDVHCCNMTAGTSRRMHISGGSGGVSGGHQHQHPKTKTQGAAVFDSKPTGIALFSSTRQPTSSSTNISSACLVNNGNCSHLCLISSTPPNYATCACPTGVRLRADGRSCPQSPDTVLLLARRTDIRRISLDTADYTSVTVPLGGSGGEKRSAARHINVLDYDPVEGRIYWADDELRLIRRAFLNGSQVETIVSTELYHPDGVAVDWLSRNLYFTDAGTDRIEVVRLDGSARKTLINEGLEKPRAIVLHPIEGLLFWSDWGVPVIERAALDGSSRMVVVNESVTWPNGLAIDYPAARLYFCDAKLDTVESVNFDGSERKLIFADANSHFYGFTLFGDWIYWSDWQRRSVERVHKLTGDQRQTIVDQLPDLMGIKAVWVEGKHLLEQQNEQVERSNPCGVSNGGCSHLCLKQSRTEAVCVCPAGYELDSVNGKQCRPFKAYFLLLRTDDIRSLPLEVVETKKSTITALINGGTAFDVDVPGNSVYWIEVSSSSSSNRKSAFILRSALNGSSISRSEVVVTLDEDGEASSHYSLAVDFISKNIYWSSSGRSGGRIEVVRGDGSFRRVIVMTNGVSKPHTIVVDPTVGFLFWTDWSSAGEASLGTVQRSFLDGEGRLTIAKGISGGAWALTADYNSRRLYWFQKTTTSILIVSVSYSGEGKVAFEVEESFETVPVSMAIFGDLLYLLEPVKQRIISLNKTAASGDHQISAVQTEVVRESFELDSTTSFLIYDGLSQRGWNFCAAGNGGNCEQLCFARASRAKSSITDLVHCSCAAHYRLEDDGRSCLEPESFLLFSHRNEVTRFLYDGEHQKSSHFLESVTTSLGSGKQNSIRALAYDQLPTGNGWIYYIDGKNTSIRRAHLNGTGAEVILEAEGLVDILIDSPSRLLFWTSTSSNAINASRLSGSSAAVAEPLGAIFQSPTDRPRLLAYHGLKHLLFWSNDRQSATIERLSLTTSGGMTKSTIIGDSLPGEVMALTVDTELHYLLWSSGGESIEYSDLDGRDRRVLYSELNIEPIAMTTNRRHLFWAEGRARRTVEKVPLDLNNGRNKQTLFRRTAMLTDIIAVQPLRNASNCLENNGGCSHLCLAVHNTSKVGSSRCACPKGLVLSEDGKKCTEPIRCEDSHDLGRKQFACFNGIACIDAIFRCNGIPDCIDESDERNCPSCPAAGHPNKKQFTCLAPFEQSNNQQLICLEEGRVCDGIKDCHMNADEMCCADKFRCNSRHCLTSDQLCDGKKDCTDGEDEDATVCQLYSKSTVIISEQTTKTTSASTSGSRFSVSLIIIIAFITLLLFFIVLQCKRCVSAAAEKQKHFQQHQQQNSTSSVQGFLMTERNGGRLVGTADSTTTTTGTSMLGGHNRTHHHHRKNQSLLRQRSDQTNNNTLTSTTTVLSLGQMDLLPQQNQTPYPSQMTTTQQQLMANNNNSENGSSGGSGPVVAYPCETVNPPPSPCTERSASSTAAYSTYSSSLFVPRPRGKQQTLFKATNKNSRRKKGRWAKGATAGGSGAQWAPLVRGPPPTPCGTDVFDDDDAMPPLLLNKEQHINTGLADDDEEEEDLFNSYYKPPPPTPRNYFSDAEGGGSSSCCPPSPVTEHSFCALNPPPPSPVQQEYELL